METRLQWARRQFEQIARMLEQSGFKKRSEVLVSAVQPPPSQREIVVQLFPHLPTPYVRVTDAPKPNLLPSISGPTPEATRIIQFDAVEFETAFQWLELGGDTGFLTTSEVVQRALGLAEAIV